MNQYGIRVVSAREPTSVVLDNIAHERLRQIDKWGVQDHPHVAEPGQGGVYDTMMRIYTAYNDGNDQPGWDTILLEELYEALTALAQGDISEGRTELVQVAAVATAWIEQIDRDNEPRRRLAN